LLRIRNDRSSAISGCPPSPRPSPPRVARPRPSDSCCRSTMPSRPRRAAKRMPPPGSCPRDRHRETGRSPSPRPRAPVIPVITTGPETPPEPEGRSTSRIRKLHGSSAVSAIQVGPPDPGGLPGSVPDSLKSRPGPVMIAGVMSAWRDTTTAGTEGADSLSCRAWAGFL
jgi:hypothetical protein